MSLDVHELDSIVNVPRSGNPLFERRWRRYVTRLTNSKPRGILYHYTSLETSSNILRSGNIRFFNPLVSNDTAELENARERVIRFLSDKRRRTTSKARKDVCEKVSKYVEACEEYFVFCLTDGSQGSGGGDSLEMWRAYGRDGDGVALGFDFANYPLRLGGTFDIDDISLYGADVIYEDENKDRLIERVYDYFMELRGFYNLPYASIIKPIAHCYMMLLPLFKHNCFASEREHRVIAVPSGAARFGLPMHQDPKSLKSYAEFQLWDDNERAGRFTPLNMNHVIIGPGRTKELNAHSFKQLLRHCYLEVPVYISKIPYRPKG